MYFMVWIHKTILTKKEALRFAGIGAAKLLEWEGRGLPFSRDGRKKFYQKDARVRFMEEVNE